MRETIQLFFATFRRCGTAGATVKVFQDQGLRFPTRPADGPNKGEVVWHRLRYSRALHILDNVRYAGAFAFGRTRTRKTVDGHCRTRRVPRDEWAVLIQKAHDGYISWDEFEENRRRLRENSQRLQGMGGTTPAREGSALLQGLVVCGVCGCHMTTAYHVRGGRRIPNYVCQRSELPWARNYCQRVTGACIDEAIGELLVQEMNPMALQLAIDVQRELQQRAEQADRLRYREVERARYEADSARRRYMRIDPDNRLVADALEATWNDKLRAIKAAQEDYERRRQHDGQVTDDAQRERILSLATDFPRLWKVATTSDRDRKRMIRLIVEDVTLVRQHASIRVHVRFRGGKTESLEVTPPPKSWQKRLTSPEAVAEVDRLLNEHTLDEIAEILNRLGYRSGDGLLFTRQILKNVCAAYRLKSRRKRLLTEGLVSRRQLARSLGVGDQTIARWQRAGRSRAKRCNDKNEYLFELPTADNGPKPRRRRSMAQSGSGQQSSTNR